MLHLFLFDKDLFWD